jgi:hypothetical protein
VNLYRSPICEFGDEWVKVSLFGFFFVEKTNKTFAFHFIGKREFVTIFLGDRLQAKTKKLIGFIDNLDLHKLFRLRQLEFEWIPPTFLIVLYAWDQILHDPYAYGPYNLFISIWKYYLRTGNQDELTVNSFIIYSNTSLIC